ncbi:kinase-like domain-containing protein [Mycena belliarum]|uniref:Kinase-like domain-containing protein n=1 Tax=Mycena belliarum TaxID=1033014 RepID=A0AAD6UIK4_9AGAR|nr:kinase-like domain-containing protein [Mycena belliae]
MFVPTDRCPTSEPSHPGPGTTIDNGALELVEVLGVGGYGVVYRAVETRSPIPRQYAVKCLMHPPTSVTPRQRQLHIREIALHQLSGAHPNVVTLHRVVEEHNCTYIIMDYASDGDLFSQILYGCRYLGNTRLIKHVFNQLLDAVDYCHSLGIYHRDLKPENVLCFDGGYRVAITDFGLATTEKLSEEFRTGSVYHMSPECQGGEFAPSGSYSPMFNDIWSLGIVLLNLTTGRNPWKAATLSDSTFRAYLHSPAEFLTSVLPISAELNAVLIRMLDIDWRHRMTIPQLRVALGGVKDFYSAGAVFEGSMARCPWEVGVDLEASPVKDHFARRSLQQRRPEWSKESSLVFAHPHATRSGSSSSTRYSSCGATWAFDSPTSSDSDHIFSEKFMFERPRTPPQIDLPLSPISPCSSESQHAAFIVTPSIVDFPLRRQAKGLRKPLTINTTLLSPQYYTAQNTSLDSASTGSSVMQTAVDDLDPYASSFFLASSKVTMADSADLGEVSEDKEMSSPGWGCSADEMSRYSSTRSSILVRPKRFDDDRSATPSPDTEAAAWHDQCQYASSIYQTVTDAPPPRSEPHKKYARPDAASTDSPLHHPIKFFALPASASGPPPAKDGRSDNLEPFQSFIFHQTPSSPSLETWTAFSASSPQTPHAAAGGSGSLARGPHLRAIRPWFLRAKLFGSSGDPFH